MFTASGHAQWSLYVPPVVIMNCTVVTICTASGHAQWSIYVPPVVIMYCTLVTICTAQWSLYAPHSGHYLYRTVVTICTASSHYIYRQWSIYVTYSGHYMYRQWSFYVLHNCHYMYRTVVIYGPPMVTIRGGADKSLARPTSPCRRTESIVSLERGICSCAEFQYFSCYTGRKRACQARRAISTTSRRELSSSFFFPAGQGAEGNSRHSERNNRGTCTIVYHRQKLGGPV